MVWYRHPVRILRNTAAVAGLYGFIVASDPRAAIYEYAVLPILRQVYDGEDAHRLAIAMMRYPALNPRLSQDWLERLDPAGALRSELFAGAANPRVRRFTLATPVGVAAGLDKNGEAVDSLFQLGFSWVEVGSVTPLPQAGNPRPRVFRLPEDHAIINRYGFNSDGHAAVLARLRTREVRATELLTRTGDITGARGRVLAVNLGKNKTGDEVGDYVAGVRTFGAHAGALVVNISSPNTPGLRLLQGEAKLGGLLRTLVNERDALPGHDLPPLLVKIAPDLSQEEASSIARVVRDAKVDGVIVGNTTLNRAGLQNTEYAGEAGGLSGPPVKELQLRVLRTLRSEAGPELTIIGCGGITSGEDALDYARAGANFVQLYTSFVYRGPGTAALVTEEIQKGLAGRTWAEVSGTALASPAHQAFNAKS